MRDAVYALSALTGVAGTGFHAYNVLKRPGGMAWQNLFYGAPLGAPFAILLSGLLGVYSERLREHRGATPRVLGLPAGRALAALTARGCSAPPARPGCCISEAPTTDPFMFRR